MVHKLYKLVYEDHEVNGREFTKVKMLALDDFLTEEILKPVIGTKPTPGFHLNFMFNGKSHPIVYPIRHFNGTIPAFRPMNEYKSNNPNETRKVIEFSGDSFRNVFKDDPNYDDKIHLKDCLCFYESTTMNFTIPVEKLVEI